MRNTGPSRSADWLFLSRLGAGVTCVSSGKKSNQNADNCKHCCRNCDQIGLAEIAYKMLGGVGSDDCSERSADGNKSIQTLALFYAQKVRHERSANGRI